MECIESIRIVLLVGVTLTTLLCLYLMRYVGRVEYELVKNFNEIAKDVNNIERHLLEKNGWKKVKKDGLLTYFERDKKKTIYDLKTPDFIPFSYWKKEADWKKKKKSLDK